MAQEVKKFDPLIQQISEAIIPMHKIVVVDTETKNAAMVALQQAKGLKKLLEDTRVKIVTPHNDFVKKQNARAKEIGTPLDEIISKLDKALVAHNRKVLADQEEERRRIEQEKKRNAFAAAEAMSDAHVIAPDAKALAEEQKRIGQGFNARRDELDDQKKALNAEAVSGVRKNWKFRITDAAAVSQSFLVPDEVAIGKTVRALGLGAEKVVGGIEVWSDDKVASGAIMPERAGKVIR